MRVRGHARVSVCPVCRRGGGTLRVYPMDGQDIYAHEGCVLSQAKEQLASVGAPHITTLAMAIDRAVSASGSALARANASPE